jgi:hypothetical protein
MRHLAQARSPCRQGATARYLDSFKKAGIAAVRAFSRVCARARGATPCRPSRASIRLARCWYLLARTTDMRGSWRQASAYFGLARIVGSTWLIEQLVLPPKRAFHNANARRKAGHDKP